MGCVPGPAQAACSSPRSPQQARRPPHAAGLRRGDHRRPPSRRTQAPPGLDGHAGKRPAHLPTFPWRQGTPRRSRMSVKELAAELGLSPTRLYRHVRQLEEARLVKVAETRMVSGILEQRYQASGRDVRFGADLLQHHPDKSMAAFHVPFDEFVRGFLKAKSDAAGRDDAGAQAFKPMMVAADATIAPAAAAELARRMR